MCRAAAFKLIKGLNFGMWSQSQAEWCRLPASRQPDLNPAEGRVWWRKNQTCKCTSAKLRRSEMIPFQSPSKRCPSALRKSAMRLTWRFRSHIFKQKHEVLMITSERMSTLSNFPGWCWCYPESSNQKYVWQSSLWFFRTSSPAHLELLSDIITLLLKMLSVKRLFFKCRTDIFQTGQNSCCSSTASDQPENSSTTGCLCCCRPRAALLASQKWCSAHLFLNIWCVCCLFENVLAY